MNYLTKYEQPMIFNSILDRLGKTNINISSITDSAKAHIIYGLTVLGKNSSCICCSNIFEARKLIQDLKFFSDIEIEYFPAKDILYYDIDAESKETQVDRISVIKNILRNNNKKIIVTTIDALLVNIPDLTTLKDDMEFIITEDTEIKYNDIIDKLTYMGYERCEAVEGVSQFAVRGGIIDVFPIQYENPVRIEFFGDEVDNIRTFDIISQRSIDRLESVKISFVKEINLDEDVKIEAINKIEEVLSKDLVSDKLKDYFKEDIEKIRLGEIEGIIDKYFEILVKKPKNLLDYIKDYNIFINEPTRCMEKARNLNYENIETIKVLVSKDYIYEPFVQKVKKYEDVIEKLDNTIFLENINTSKANLENRENFILDFKEENFYRSSFETLIDDLKRHKDFLKFLVFPTKVRAEQVRDFLIDNKIKVELVNDIFDVEFNNKDTVYVINSILSSGFSSECFKIYALAEGVSGIKSKPKPKKKEDKFSKVIDSYYDLEIGDYIVHENHGIGIYKGIQSVEIDNVKKDYIKLEYLNNAILYVPISQLDSVKRYVCDEDTKPKVNSLNGKDWQKTKRKVTEHVNEMAKELVNLYAKRENSKGHAFDKDTEWQKEFEDAFEYELTLDQAQAIKEIKEDMEKDTVMDRLLCGDVGYGKTEVALRAAFKAVMGGKQVAYLVPTTVLSLQQYETFKSRMEPFGVRVEMLSRFKSKTAQTKILKDLIDGKIDIIVGTHRLLSKDVFFKDLGLLIIDEEHRFGVKAKETIKMIKNTVDVLSMTATPIPRTLHMSLMGIRSMSTLSEPPLERLPIHTYVLEYDETIIKEAIENELLRDGQVFYVNNRVENIEEITEKVRRLVPRARIAYAHGQMSPDEIERVMLKFMKHELDIVVCTTILETGIDIQNANTIIIENADKLGLAQLYQIRGRVGRSSRLAYAYITYEKDKQITELSEKRLKAIKDFTEFGSGFKIALRDLEIRGAGSLLGSKQHGHMIKVGYEMYMSLLERAVEVEQQSSKGNTKKEEFDVKKDVKIDINVSAYIDDSYIKDPIQKILMYQKISDIETKEDSLDVVDELLDRYGNIPKETENLIKIVEIRNVARKLGISKICVKGENLILDPINAKFTLTNKKTNDILVYVELVLNTLLKEKKENCI